MTTVPKAVLASAAAGLALSLAGCSSSKGTSSATTAASAPSAPAMTLSPSKLLQTSDLPTGWTASGAVKTGRSSSLQNGPAYLGPEASQTASCLGTSINLNADVPEITGPNYTAPGGGEMTAQESIDAFTSASDAKASAAVFSSSKAPGCISAMIASSSMMKQIQSSLPKGGSVGKVTVTLGPNPMVGDASGNLQMEIPISVQGVSVNVYVNEVVVVVGNLEAGITFTNLYNPFPTAQLDQIAKAAYQRLSS